MKYPWQLYIICIDYKDWVVGIICLFILFYFHTTIKYIKGTVSVRPQIAKANCGGRSYTQSVVKPVINKLLDGLINNLFQKIFVHVPLKAEAHCVTDCYDTSP